MNTRNLASMSILACAALFTGCALFHPVGMSVPNAGITVTSSQLPGGPYSNGEIKVIDNNPAYGTQWCPYQGTQPSNPIWRSTATVPGNPGTFVPGSWKVMLKANQPVNFQPNPVLVNVVAGYRTRIAVTYP